MGEDRQGMSPQSEEEILAGAADRIERHRKADGVVEVVDGGGKPVAGAAVRVEQVRHAFLFGCNAFPLLQHQDPEQEGAYQRRFTALHNYATLAFYWGFYEREPGRTREEQLRQQARWLRERGIATKGHPLIWYEVFPRWGPSDPDEAREQSRARVAEIVSGFQGLVDRWDVVNEATSVPSDFNNGVAEWFRRDGAVTVVSEALAWAREAGPEAQLVYNDYNVSPAFEQLIADLIAADAPMDAIGIQSHMHGGEWPITQVWEVCETYQRFGLPLHFTEVTVLSGEHGWRRPQPWPTTPEGERRQADYVARLYTTLFSHPAVEAITWWDLMDGAWQGAPAGLLRADLSPKPAYERLLELVKGEWWTSVELATGSDGRAAFRGFLGDYRVTVGTDSGEFTGELALARDAENRLEVVVE